jgi:predicted DNA-binding transcriptional regulator YafY
MKQRSPNMEGVLLALELLKRIPRRTKITAAELRQQLADIGFDRDLRSVQRQLDILSQHFDIERDDRNRPYGYCWKEQSSGLSLPGLNEKESMLLTLAEQHLRNLLPASLMRSMDGFFQQAKMVLGKQSSGKPEREWLRKVRVASTTQPLLPPKVKDGVFEAVSNALFANHWLTVDYTNASGERKRGAKVMPLGLAQQGPRLFLVCRFEGYGNERSLALHRMQSAVDTKERFTPPAEFDLKAFDADGRFGFGNGKRIKLSFRVSKGSGAYLLETPLSSDQQVKEIGDEYEITATVIESNQLIWWLRGFGNQVRVLQPANLLSTP